MLWDGNIKQALNEIHGHTYENTIIAALVECLTANIRQAQLILVSSAYSTINIDSLADLLVYSVEETHARMYHLYSSIACTFVISLCYL